MNFLLGMVIVFATGTRPSAPTRCTAKEFRAATCEAGLWVVKTVNTKTLKESWVSSDYHWHSLILLGIPGDSIGDGSVKTDMWPTGQDSIKNIHAKVTIRFTSVKANCFLGMSTTLAEWGLIFLDLPIFCAVQNLAVKSAKIELKNIWLNVQTLTFHHIPGTRFLVWTFATHSGSKQIECSSLTPSLTVQVSWWVKLTPSPTSLF